ncbi:hypothetical protein L208DRAFT_1203561, partial [Tricholoma matsutake]
GRPSGASNYLAEDISVLLDYVEQELPLGQHGWNKVHHQLLKWAYSCGHPARAVKSLETKYKQLVKIKKPMGSGVCPPKIKQAQKIDEKINEHAGTRNLSDSDFDGDGNGSD